MFSSINKDISSLKTLTTEQSKTIEEQKRKITELEKENRAKNQTSQKENQTMFSSINKDISSLKTLTTEQNKAIETQKLKITEIEKENQNLSKQMKQITLSLTEQKLNNATKLEVSGNNINLVNDKGEVMSTIPIPSSIKQYSFESNSGHIQLTNKLLIQWGRYIPSNWCSGKGRIKIDFPIPFATKPFMATGGGHGGNFHPSADDVTEASFKTGYDNGDPTTWIAVGTI